MYKFKLKENEYGPKGFEVGDVKVKDGTQSTVTDVNATTGAITWDLENVGAFDTVYKTFDELNQLLKTLESGGEAKSDSVIDSIADNVKNLFNQYRTHIRKNYPESWEKVKLVRESNQSEWEAIDVSRTAEKELSNKEWNERTAKKLAILKSLNDEGKFKKKWDEEKLQGWVDKNYSWEKVSLQSISEELSIGGKKVKTINKNGSNNPEDYTVEYEDGTSEPYVNTLEEEVDEGEDMGYMTPNAFSKNKKSNNTYKYKLGSPFNKPVPKKIKGSGLEVKELWETETINEFSDFQQKRINMFNDVEEKVNSLSPLLSNAKNETAQYYNENPGSYTIVYSTDMVNELLGDITKLLKQGE